MLTNVPVMPPVCPNGVLVLLPSRAPDLAARLLELNLMTEYDPQVYPALWDALADDYVEVYGPESVVAENCRRKSAHYRALGAY